MTGHVTRLFLRWRDGDESAATELIPRVYDELRGLAGSYLRKEREGHTLQPTELVNEALLRLLGADVEALDRTHFFALAAKSMRRILIDHARRLQAGKRFAPEDRVTLVTEIAPIVKGRVDVLDLHQALERFSEIAPRPSQLVELRYFAGLTNAEAAVVLGVSRPTVERDWKAARVWLRQELQG
ncbi:MAG: ECF-type sigma factor [Acidobacteriota bacterium]